MHRRTFLVASSVLLGSVAGCLSDEAPTEPGTLLVVNDDQRSHEVEVSVQRTSDTPTDVPESEAAQDPQPVGEPLWEDTASIQIDADAEVERSGFVPEPGAYYFEASVVGMGSLDFWMGFDSGDEGTGVSGGYPRVRIFDEDEFAFTREKYDGP